MSQSLTPRPRLKSCFRCEIIPAEGVVLLAENQSIILANPALIELVQLLDGQHTLAEIIVLLQDKMSSPAVFSLLMQIREYVVDAPPPMPVAQAAMWELLGIKPEVAYQRLQSSTLNLITCGDIDPTPFESMLTDMGVQISPDGERSIILTDDYLQVGLEAIDRQALAANRPWMLVKPVGTEIWLGPLFVPGQTGCWECLRARLQGHRKVETYLQQKHNTNHPFLPSLAVLPSTQHTALSLAATAAAKWIVTGTNLTLEGNIVTLNPLTLAQRTHRLTRRPQCPACGQPDLVAQSQSIPPVLQSRPKGFSTDGGHRSISPAETFQQLEPQISPITGIISSLTPPHGWAQQQELTPAYLSYGIFSDWSQDLDSLRRSLSRSASGKGKSDIQAKVSALGEAIEHYAGGFQGDECRIRDRFNNLAQSIHPNACMLFSDRQYQNRELGSANSSHLTWVPKPFDPEQEIEWSPVWSLSDDRPRYLPTAYCYYGYARQHQIEFTRADSNGCAAGNTLEEAILQGFLELVERDSVALWWYNRLSKPAVDLAAFNEPYFQALLDFYQQHHRDLWVLDLTGDLNIPTFAAISRRNDRAVENIILGFGTHLDPQIAILRALTELNQSLPAVLFNKYEQSRAYRDCYPEALAWWQTATIENQPYLIPDRTVKAKTPADYPHTWSDNLETDVMNCVNLAQSKGLETLVLDLTRPDVGLAVVKVIVPGLRHFWPRFAPGRLYDIPVQMGCLTAPLAEEQFNPQPIFF
jgi:oxazoline/thiazoline synthase